MKTWRTAKPTSMLAFSRNFFVISTSRLKISFRSSRPRLLGLSNGSGFKLPPTIGTLMLSGISAFVVSASRFKSIFSRSSVSGFDGSIRLSASVGLLPQNDVSKRHLCGLGDLKKYINECHAMSRKEELWPIMYYKYDFQPKNTYKHKYCTHV